MSAQSRVIAACIVVLACSACSLIRPEAPPPPPVERGVLSLPERPGYPGEIAAVQNIHAVRGDRSADLQAVVEASPEHLVMVLALPLGSRLATIDWSAKGVSVEREVSLPAGRAVQPRDVLADLVLAYWPEDAVRASLHQGLTLAAEPGRREVRRGDEVLVEVRRDDADPWNGQTVLDNRMLGYRLTIDSQVAPDA